MENKSKVVFCRHTCEWVLLDSDGYRVAGYDKPSKARKAKLYWWLYLTLDEGHMKYLDKLTELGGYP